MAGFLSRLRKKVTHCVYIHMILYICTHIIYMYYIVIYISLSMYLLNRVLKKARFNILFIYFYFNCVCVYVEVYACECWFPEERQRELDALDLELQAVG